MRPEGEDVDIVMSENVAPEPDEHEVYGRCGSKLMAESQNDLSRIHQTRSTERVRRVRVALM